MALPAFPAQKRWEGGGYVESAGVLFARRPNAADARAIGTQRLQLWGRASISPRLSWRGRMDFRIDTHQDVDRNNWLDLSQRGLHRPAGALTEFYFDARLGRLDLRLGQQEIRWGRADGFNPTDNLAPYDYLDTFSEERLAAPALKADLYAGRGRLEAVWIPFYTPTRLPLLGQRWFPRLPESAPYPPGAGEAAEVRLDYRDIGGPFPARTLGNGQWGLRWNQLVRRAEFSFSYFDGFDDIPYFRPDFGPVIGPEPHATVSLRREYFRVRVAGADFASELGPFGIRGEMAWFDRNDPDNLDHLLFVLGLDRAWGDWFVIAQYAGQKVAGKLPDATLFPDLALRSTLIGRVERSLGPSRSFEVQGLLRMLDGDFLLQPLYSVAITNRWRLKVGASLFGGPEAEYLGQFRDSSHLFIELRCTF